MYTSPNTSRNRTRTRSRSPMHRRINSSHSPRSRSPWREERYSRTDSNRSHSEGRRIKNYEHRGARRPDYNGPTEPVNLDSDIQISINSRQSSSPRRTVTVRPRDGNRVNDSINNTSSQQEVIIRGESVGTFSRHDRRKDSPLPSRRNGSPSRAHRDDHSRSYERNRRNETLRDRSPRDRRLNSSRDRSSRRETSRNRESESLRSTRRSGYDENSKSDRNLSRRRYSRDSSRRSSHEASDRSHNEEEHDGSENEENGKNGEAVATGGPVAGIRAPMWPVPFRSFPPRLPMIPHPPPMMIPFFRPPRPMFPRPGMGMLLPVPRPPPSF